MFNQILRKAIGTECTPSYACQTIGYKKEEYIFKMKLPKFFNEKETELAAIYFNPIHEGGAKRSPLPVFPL